MQFIAEGERLRQQIDVALAAVMAAERARLEADIFQAITVSAPEFLALLEIIDDGTGASVASHWAGHPIDRVSGRAALDWAFPHCSAPEHDDIRLTVALVADAWNIPAEQLRARVRTRRYTNPRQVLCYLLHEHLGLSYSEIGRMIQRDHSTVMSNTHAVRRRIAAEPYFAKRVTRLSADLDSLSRRKVVS